MAIVHICDRCGVEKRYTDLPRSHPAPDDPLGYHAPRLCEDCQERFGKVQEALRRYFEAVYEAYQSGQPQPPAPEFW